MSSSLYNLFQELSVSDQQKIRSYVAFRKEPVAYLKQQIANLSSEEIDELDELINDSSEEINDSSPEEIEYEKFSFETMLSRERLSPKRAHSNPIEQALTDQPDRPMYTEHCTRCTCHDNDDCACIRGCDHYLGSRKDLDRELEKIAYRRRSWYRGNYISPF